MEPRLPKTCVHFREMSEGNGQDKNKVTYCVRNVKAALVIDVGKFNPLVILLHNLFRMT